MIPRASNIRNNQSPENKHASVGTMNFAMMMVSAICIGSSVALGQSTPMTPSPPHEALAFFEGRWTTDESPPESGFVESCSFMNAGRRHMICRSTWTTSTGPRESMSIFSYSAADSTYLYYGLRAGGSVEPMRGQLSPDGKGWVFTSEKGSGATRQRERVTITSLGGERFRLVAESATGDGPWKTEATQHYRPASSATT